MSLAVAKEIGLDINTFTNKVILFANHAKCNSSEWLVQKK